MSQATLSPLITGYFKHTVHPSDGSAPTVVINTLPSVPVQENLLRKEAGVLERKAPVSSVEEKGSLVSTPPAPAEGAACFFLKDVPLEAPFRAEIAHASTLVTLQHKHAAICAERDHLQARLDAYYEEAHETLLREDPAYATLWEDSLKGKITLDETQAQADLAEARCGILEYRLKTAPVWKGLWQRLEATDSVYAHFVKAFDATLAHHTGFDEARLVYATLRALQDAAKEHVEETLHALTHLKTQCLTRRKDWVDARTVDLRARLHESGLVITSLEGLLTKHGIVLSHDQNDQEDEAFGEGDDSLEDKAGTPGVSLIEILLVLGVLCAVSMTTFMVYGKISGAQYDPHVQSVSTLVQTVERNPYALPTSLRSQFATTAFTPTHPMLAYTQGSADMPATATLTYQGLPASTCAQLSKTLLDGGTLKADQILLNGQSVENPVSFCIQARTPVTLTLQITGTPASMSSPE